MNIVLIIIIAFVVLSIGAKLHRGSFFRWNDKRDAPNARADGQAGDERR
jgi:hypothetical protein